MIVISLTDCPLALRGDLTKWLQEINTGVYVGQVSARVRDELWKRIQDNIKNGRATMVYSAQNEQRLDFRVHNTSWEPIDFDGLKLMLRPSPARLQQHSQQRLGFSNASKAQKAKQMARRKRAKAKPTAYVVIDIETTGVSVAEDEIIEMGVLVVNKGKIEKEFQTLVKAEKKISEAIEELTGINDKMIREQGKELNEVLTDVIQLMGELPIVCHNADFEKGFLKAAFKRHDIPAPDNQFIDTLTMARKLVEDISNYKLATLLNYFKIDAGNSHRSIQDCKNTRVLYEKLIEIEEKQ